MTVHQTPEYYFAIDDKYITADEIRMIFFNKLFYDDPLVSAFSRPLNTVTPLLPEESTGLTITGKWNKPSEASAKLLSPYPSERGALKPFRFKKALNSSLLQSVFTAW